MIERERALPTVKDERGMALVISLMVMVLLTLVGTLFLTTSTTESTISRNEISTARTFELADAGVQHAKKSLESLNLSDVIADTATVFAGSNTGSLGGGTYTVDVTNNFGAGFPRGTIAADAAAGACVPSATVDCDRIVVVNSTGSFQNSEKIVETIVRVPLPMVVSGALSTLDGTDTPSAEVEDLKDGSTIDGNDCNPPSAGGGPGPGPDKPGIGVESAGAKSDLIADINDPSLVTGGGGGSPDVQIDSEAMSGSELTAIVNALIASGTAIGSAPCSGGIYGTPATPQVCYGTSIPTGSTGAGILVFTDDVEIENLTYEGIIIVVGDGRFRLFGSSNIYGAVVHKNYGSSHSGETRMRMEDGASICYSSAAVQTASSNSEVAGATMAWYEQ